MTKNEFMKRLELELERVPENDRKDMLYDFEEHFEMALANGETEEEAAKNLGDPKNIAKDLLIDYHITQAEQNHSIKNITQAVIATVSLSFFNIVFVMGPVVAVIGIFIGLCGTAATLVLAPLAWILSLFFGTTNVLQEFFVSLALCGSGILLGIGLVYLGKFLYGIILKYIKFNLRIVKGEG